MHKSVFFVQLSVRGLGGYCQQLKRANVSLTLLNLFACCCSKCWLFSNYCIKRAVTRQASEMLNIAQPLLSHCSYACLAQMIFGAVLPAPRCAEQPNTLTRGAAGLAHGTCCLKTGVPDDVRD